MAESEEYDSPSDSYRGEQFVTVRRKNEMPHDKEPDAASLEAQLEAKVAEIERLQQRLTIATRDLANGSASALVRRPDFRELRELVSKFNPKEPTCLSADEWIQEI